MYPNHYFKSQSSTGIKFQKLWSIETSLDLIFEILKNFHHKFLKMKNIQRAHVEHKECEEWEIFNKHTTKGSSQLHFKALSIHFPIQLEDVVFESKLHQCKKMEELSKEIK